MKRTIPALVLLLALAPSLPAQDTGPWIDCAPLQLKLDRLYLNRGLEDLIFLDCRFVVYRGDDSLYTGCIAWSHQGVSISTPTSGFFESLPLEQLQIRVETAPEDTLSEILLGCVGYCPRASPPDSLSPADSLSARVSVRAYQSQLELALAFEDNTLDGCLSYRALNAAGDHRTECVPAPFFVALVPNLSREINRGGFLTTSLYYRFDPGRLPTYFDGDSIAPFHRLGGFDHDTLRPYPYSPRQGRELLGSIRSRSREARFWVEHPMLLPAARYFADILSRDRFRTSIVDNPRDADIHLLIIPLADPGAITLRFLHTRLAADTVAGIPANETLRLIDSYLRTAAFSADSAAGEHYLALAETALRDDLGVFPLFRPALFFTAHQRLVGSVAGRNDMGELDLHTLRKVILPSKPKECRP